jgi:hypothetical protein
MTIQEVKNNFVQNLAENAYTNMCSVEEMNIVIEALEKQIPKKVNKILNKVVCPTCKTFAELSPYCRYCGQALDWSENNG